MAEGANTTLGGTSGGTGMQRGVGYARKNEENEGGINMTVRGVVRRSRRGARGGGGGEGQIGLRDGAEGEQRAGGLWGGGRERLREKVRMGRDGNEGKEGMG